MCSVWCAATSPLPDGWEHSRHGNPPRLVTPVADSLRVSPALFAPRPSHLYFTASVYWIVFPQLLPLRRPRGDPSSPGHEMDPFLSVPLERFISDKTAPHLPARPSVPLVVRHRYDHGARTEITYVISHTDRDRVRSTIAVVPISRCT